MNKYLNTLAVFIGGFFNAPSWMMYLYAYLTFVATDLFNGSLILKVLTFFLLIVLPISFTIALNQLKVVEDVDSRDKEKRLIVMSVFLATMLTLIFCGILLKSMDFVKFLLLMTLPGIFGSIINKFWLLSVHVMSAATAATIMTYLSGWPYHLVFVLVLLVAWARVKEKKHTVEQVIAGGAMGIIVSFLLLNNFFEPLQFRL